MQAGRVIVTRNGFGMEVDVPGREDGREDGREKGRVDRVEGEEGNGTRDNKTDKGC